MVTRSSLFVALDSSGNGLTPSDGRRALGALFGTTARPLLQPAATLSSSNMQVTVAQNVWQLPDPTDAASIFIAPMDSFIVTPAAGAGSARTDSIVIKQDDPQNSGTDPYSAASLIAGTPGSGAPAIPTGYYEVARVTVPAGASTASAGSVQFMYAAGLMPGALQAAGATALPNGTVVGQRAFVGALEYRWNGTGWDLLPGSTLMSHLRYIAGTTDVLLANNATTDVPFDTVVYDPQGLKTTVAGATQSSFTIPFAGRWSLYARVATTASDSANVYSLSFYNVSTSAPISSRGQTGIANSTPLDHYTEDYFAQGTVVKAQLYKGGTTANYIQHGSGLYSIASQLILRYLGPA